MRTVIIFLVLSWVLNSLEDLRKGPKESRGLDREEDLEDGPVKGRFDFPLDDLRKLFEIEEEVIEEEEKVEPVITSEHSMEQKPIEPVEEVKRERLARIKFKDSEETGYEEFNYDRPKSKSKPGYSKDKLREDVIKGIIFSEIISEPKSIRNKRRD